VLFGVLYREPRASSRRIGECRASVAAEASEEAIHGGLRRLLTTPVLLCFGYFLLLRMALTGLQSFAIPALMDFAT
jgi:hypothetical protein